VKRLSLLLIFNLIQIPALYSQENNIHNVPWSEIHSSEHVEGGVYEDDYNVRDQQKIVSHVGMCVIEKSQNASNITVYNVLFNHKLLTASDPTYNFVEATKSARENSYCGLQITRCNPYPGVWGGTDSGSKCICKLDGHHGWQEVTYDPKTHICDNGNLNNYVPQKCNPWGPTVSEGGGKETGPPLSQCVCGSKGVVYDPQKQTCTGGSIQSFVPTMSNAVLPDVDHKTPIPPSNSK